MPVTEEQAKTKKCSEMRNYRRVDIGYECEFGLCLASDCMMWKQTGPTHDDHGQLPTFRLQGYCGLAGQEKE